MFDSHRLSTGRDYTPTVALLSIAFVFSPVLLMLSSNVGYLPLLLAIACSALCMALAWASWTKTSQLSIPTITISRTGEPMIGSAL
jgi:hypothetical protein